MDSGWLLRFKRFEELSARSDELTSKEWEEFDQLTVWVAQRDPEYWAFKTHASSCYHCRTLESDFGVRLLAGRTELTQ